MCQRLHAGVADRRPRVTRQQVDQEPPDLVAVAQEEERGEQDQEDRCQHVQRGGGGRDGAGGQARLVIFDPLLRRLHHVVELLSVR